MDNETYQALRVVYSTAKEHLRNMPDLGSVEAAELMEAIKTVSNFIESHQGKHHGTYK